MTSTTQRPDMWTSVTAEIARRSIRVLGVATVFAAAACNVDNLLDVKDPDIINPGDIQDPSGAQALRNGALARLVQITGGSATPSESFWLLGGLLADEWRSGDTFIERNEIDQRAIRIQNGNLENTTRLAHRARVTALQARKSTEANDPGIAAWQIAEMFLVQGYAENILAENLCNGIALSYVLNNAAVEGEPLTDSAVFATAVAHYDSALARLGTASDANSTRIRNRANVLKARSLMNLKRFREAGAAAALVPAGTAWFVRFSDNTWYNQIWSLNNSAGRYTLPATAEGPLQMDWVGAQDPRVPNCRGDTTRTSVCYLAGAQLPVVFDGASGLPRHAQLLWTQRTDSVAITNYVEAQLIVAEVQLDSADARWLTTLNTLRATVGLPALADPGTITGRQDLLFRERGFWLFGRGYRLGDLRRLIRQYGRTQDQVFPTGTYVKGGSYGPDVNFPIPQAEQNNSKFNACLDRKA